MGLATAIMAGASLLGGVLQKKASDKATDAQVNASKDALGLQKWALEQQMQRSQPYVDFGQGQGGLGGLAALANGDYSGFYNSPDYMSARDAMQYAGDHGAAARGRVFSGGYAKDMAEAQGNLANQYLNNYRGSLQWGANLGQNAAAGQGQAAQGFANNSGNLYNQMGNAQAQGALTNANIYGNVLGGLAGIFGGTQNKTASSYGGGDNAAQFGLPSPVAPYSAMNYGSGGKYF